MAWSLGQPTRSRAQPPAPYLEPHPACWTMARDTQEAAHALGPAGVESWCLGRTGAAQRDAWAGAQDSDQEAASAPEGGSEGAEPKVGCPQAAGCLSQALCGTGAVHCPKQTQRPPGGRKQAVGSEVGAHSPSRSEHRVNTQEETLTS